MSRYKRHWERCWRLYPDRMSNNLAISRSIKIKQSQAYEQTWKQFIQSTTFPKTKSEFKIWIQSLNTKESPSTLKKYFYRHQLIIYDKASKLWILPTCSTSIDSQ